jgi:hypothetical protein
MRADCRMARCDSVPEVTKNVRTVWGAKCIALCLLVFTISDAIVIRKPGTRAEARLWATSRSAGLKARSPRTRSPGLPPEERFIPQKPRDGAAVLFAWTSFDFTTGGREAFELRGAPGGGIRGWHKREKRCTFFHRPATYQRSLAVCKIGEILLL